MVKVEGWPAAGAVSAKAGQETAKGVVKAVVVSAMPRSASRREIFLRSRMIRDQLRNNPKNSPEWALRLAGSWRTPEAYDKSMYGRLERKLAGTGLVAAFIEERIVFGLGLALHRTRAIGVIRRRCLVAARRLRQFASLGLFDEFRGFCLPAAEQARHHAVLEAQLGGAQHVVI